MFKKYLKKEKEHHTVTRKASFFLTVVTMFFFGLQMLSAQPCPPGPGGIPDCSNDDPSAVPFDGGASLLLGGGIALGVKKLYGKIRRK